MSDFHNRLLKLRSALLDRALSLLPPNATPALPGSEASGEAALIYEALAGTPVPPKTSDYAIRVSSTLDRNTASTLGLLGLARTLGIPRSAFKFDVEQHRTMSETLDRIARDLKEQFPGLRVDGEPRPTPVLGVKDERLAVLNPGTITIALNDGRIAVVDVTPDIDFGTVAEVVKSKILDFAVRGTHRMGTSLGSLADDRLGATRAGWIGICVTPGDVKTHYSFRSGERIGDILAWVSGMLADIADPRDVTVTQFGYRTKAAKSQAPASAAPPAPVMHFPRSTSGAWAGRIPDDRWVAGNVLGRSDANTPAVLNRGRITIETTDGHLALVDVEPRHTFDEVVRCVKLGLRLEIDRLTSTGKDTLFARMASSGDTCVLRRGKVTLRTSGAVETGFYVEPLESLSAVEDRVTTKLAALAGIHTPLFGCETVTGRFLTLRDGVLQVGDPLGSTEAIPVAKGASLERVLDQVKESLLKRAGAAVGNARPASAEQCRFYLYLPNDVPLYLGAGARFVPDAPLPKGHAEVVTGGTYRLEQGIPCRWVGDGPHHPMVARWVLQGGSGLCAYPLPPPPRTTDVPAHSLGIVYPKVANTPDHDTSVVPAGTLLLPGCAGSTSRAEEPSIQTIATSIVRTGNALLCKTINGSPWPSVVTLWSFESPPPGCFITASAAPPRF